MSATREAPPGVVLGAILIVIGLGFLAFRYLDVFAGQDTWPWAIVGLGAVLFVVGLIVGNAGLVIGGSVVATIGGILAWQNTTGLWATWAWIWTLIPVASGVGSFIGGVRTGDRQMRDSALWQILIGLALLAVFFLFFEQFVGLSGGQVPVPEWAMPVVLVGLGVLILVRGIIGPRDAEPAG
jgi:hypothetical protein